MAILAPFKGLTYNFNRFNAISSLVAPPYDVISEQEQQKYYQSSPHNVIRLILSKKKAGDSDWDNMYTRSADHFSRWQSEDVLIRATQPCMYVTALSYATGDCSVPKVRWGLISLVRIEDDGSSVIRPHERTFSAHKDDRLRLMRACNAQFSQIFGLYEDPEDRVFSTIGGALKAPPDLNFDFNDGTGHRMWILQDPQIFKEISAAMHEKSIFIADGHHRYETSRNFRNLMRARYGRRPANRSYEFVMMYLTNMDAQGLTILPSHRLLKKCDGFEASSFFEKVKSWFEVSVFPFSGGGGNSDFTEIQRLLEEKGRLTSAVGFYYHGGSNYYILSLKPGARADLGDDLHQSLRKLDVLVLSRLIFQKVLGFTQEDMNNEEIFHYQSDFKNAVSLVDAGTFQMTFLLNPTGIGQVREVASNALIMPRKSTYFYPKVITGLVFNKIDPYEAIQTF